MRKSKNLLKKIICFGLTLMMVSSAFIYADAENAASITDVLSSMYVISSSDFESYDAGTDAASTDFADKWDIKFGSDTAGSRIYDIDGKKTLMSSGATINDNGPVSYELKNVFFGPGEAYAVNVNEYIPASGANSVSYIFLRTANPLSTNIQWYTKEGSGSFYGGSGISVRWQATGKIEIAVRYYDDTQKCKVNTKYVRLNAPENVGAYGSSLEITAYDDGNGKIAVYLNGEEYLNIEYSGSKTYDSFAGTYYDSVVVKDTSGAAKLEVTDALAAYQGRIALSQAGRQVYIDDVTVYSADYKLDLSKATKESGNLGLLTDGESTKRGFPTCDTFIYFRNSGAMAVNLGEHDLSEFDKVTFVWWDAANNANERKYGEGKVTFALTKTGALDTTEAKQTEQEGVVKYASWTLSEEKTVSPKADFATQESVTLELSSDDNNTLYFAYMGSTNAIAVSQITFHKAESPVTEEPVTEEPATEEPTTEEPTTEEPVTEEPVTEEPVTEEPATEEPVTEEPVTEHPTTGDSALAVSCAAILLLSAAVLMIIRKYNVI